MVICNPGLSIFRVLMTILSETRNADKKPIPNWLMKLKVDPVAVDGLDIAGLVEGDADFQKVLLNPLAIHADPIVPKGDFIDVVNCIGAIGKLPIDIGGHGQINP